jgi:hypothetical protein
MGCLQSRNLNEDTGSTDLDEIDNIFGFYLDSEEKRELDAVELMPKKLRTALNMPPNSDNAMVDSRVALSSTPLSQQAQLPVNHPRAPIPTSSRIVTQRNGICRFARSGAIVDTKSTDNSQNLLAHFEEVEKADTNMKARNDVKPVPVPKPISNGSQVSVSTQNASSISKPLSKAAAVGFFRKANVTRGARRTVRNTRTNVGARSSDPVQARLAEMKVILRSLPNSMAEKTRLCSSSRQTKQGTAATSKPKTNTVRESRNVRIPKMMTTSYEQKKDGQSNDQSSSTTIWQADPAAKLPMTSQQPLKENVSPCGPEVLDTSSRPTLDRATVEKAKTSDTSVTTKGKDDASETCIRCKTRGCRKMMEWEKQRLVQMKRQRLNKTTKAAGKRQYHQRKEK